MENMKLKTVTKRSGSRVVYDRSKIHNAIAKANVEVDGDGHMSEAQVDEVTQAVEAMVSRSRRSRISSRKSS